MPAHKPPHPLLDLPDMTPDLNPDLATERMQARLKAAAGIPSGMVIVRDTREQSGHGWHYPGMVRRTLKTGDYSVDRMTDLITIERKSKADLYGTLSTPRRRRNFDEELARMREMRWAVLVVEATMQDFRLNAPPVPGPMLKRGLKWGRVATWERVKRLHVKHCLPIWWCNGRKQARDLSLSLMVAVWGEFWREMDVEGE